MADFNFRISPNITLGSYAASRLGDFSREWGNRYMVLLDPVLKSVGIADKILIPLTDRKIDFFIFDDLTAPSDTEIITTAVNLARDAHVQGIITCGGSKAISIGRTIAAIFNDKRTIYDILDTTMSVTDPLPVICVPTTIRDSFIFSDYTPIVDSRTSQAKLLKIKNSTCKLVIFDPNLMVTIADNQLAAMSLETICMAVEAYVSQKSNFFSDMIIEKSIELFSYALGEETPLSVASTSDMILCEAGCMASLACAVSSTGMASLLSLCINARYNISRSLVSTILFPHMIEDIAQYKNDKLVKLASLFRILPENVDPSQVAGIFSENIRQRIAKANLPARLKDLSVTIDQLSLAVQDAASLDISNTLSRSMTADDMFEILKAAY